MPLESPLSSPALLPAALVTDTAYWLADMGRSRFLFMSPAFEALWGCSLASLHEQPARYLQAIHPDDLAVFGHGQPLAGGRQQRCFRVRQPDGRYRRIGECTFTMISPFGGEPRLAGVAFALPDDDATLDSDWLAGKSVRSWRRRSAHAGAPPRCGASSSAAAAATRGAAKDVPTL